MITKIGFYQKDKARIFEFEEPGKSYNFTVSVERISNKVWDHINVNCEYKTDNGTIIVFDAHGVWFTKNEIDEIFNGLDDDKIHWCTDEIPELPQK